MAAVSSADTPCRCRWIPAGCSSSRRAGRVRMRRMARVGGALPAGARGADRPDGAVVLLPGSGALMTRESAGRSTGVDAALAGQRSRPPAPLRLGPLDLLAEPADRG